MRIERRRAAERAGEIEAEAVDVERLDPVAQRIHHHLQHARMRELQRIAGAGVVLVEARRVGHEPVVGGVVDAAIAQRGPEMIALGGVVVDHVEDHLDAGAVQLRDRRAERVLDVVGGVAVLGREEAQRVVAPVVLQPVLEQMRLVDEGVDRQQLDRGDAELVQMLDHRRRGEAAIGAAQLLRNVLAQSASGL